MAELLRGKAVADAITEKNKQKLQVCLEKGITPTLAILRVGEREEDLSYERGAVKRCETTGVSVKKVVLPADVSKEDFYQTLDDLNRDDTVHGILMFRPLPKYLDNEKARNSISPEKDIDGCSDMSLGGIFTGKKGSFAPCTAQAVLEILDYYGIEISGKNAVVIGRSLVIGRPAGMLLMEKNATVTYCHSRTKDLSDITKRADIVITAIGKAEYFTKEYFSPGQTVIDVGISWNETKGKICGDVLFEEAEEIVDKITPVPGGVGSVTTSVLVSHVIDAAFPK